MPRSLVILFFKNIFKKKIKEEQTEHTSFPSGSKGGAPVINEQHKRLHCLKSHSNLHE
jgi:hypothetical protein